MALQFTSVQNETIAAIATGISESGIGIIRISGPDAIAVGDRLYRDRKGRRVVTGWKANTIHFGYIVDPERINSSKSKGHEEGKNSGIAEQTETKDSGKYAEDFRNAIVDEVMVSIMRVPHSYTTEDTIEINCHGGVYLMNRILQLVLKNGCRMAEPGEFTKRAFLGGRIDLSQAEAVMDLIDSRNEFSRKTALSQLEGSVSGKIKALRESLLYEIAFIESALDDPENYSLEGYPQRLRKKCISVRDELDHILAESRNGRILKDGIRTVIVGRPNAGKSSLLNLLAGEERAIVTDVAGTTRDTLEESVRIGDLVLDLVDTAGIHETEDTVEKIGVDRARSAMEHADLILFLVDLSEPLGDADREIADLIRNQQEKQKETRCVVLMNKSDLPAVISEEDVRKLIDRADAYIPVSASTGEGLERLQERLLSMFHAGEISASNEVFLSSVREQQEAAAARDSLNLVVQSIDKGLSEDFFSIDLMNAYTELGKILGESVEDDLVEEIFSKFCLGK